jgi:hypothetical protein
MDRQANSKIGDRLRQFAVDMQCRPDTLLASVRLTQIFQRHRGALWPKGDPHATEQWIESHVLAVTKQLARLYDLAASQGEPPVEFYRRMAPVLADIIELGKGRARPDA